MQDAQVATISSYYLGIDCPGKFDPEDKKLPGNKVQTSIYLPTYTGGYKNAPGAESDISTNSITILPGTSEEAIELKKYHRFTLG